MWVGTSSVLSTGPRKRQQWFPPLLLKETSQSKSGAALRNALTERESERAHRGELVAAKGSPKKKKRMNRGREREETDGTSEIVKATNGYK